MSEQAKKRLNTREAADYLGLSESYLNKDRISAAQIPFFKIGKRVLYDVSDLDAFMAARKRMHDA